MTLLVLALTVLLLSSVAHSASIVGSKHDLQWAWNYANSKGSFMIYTLNNYGEVCVYCHTPHGANTEAGAPLWNRATPVGPYTMYASPTMINDQPGAPSGLSLVCLSCHDGAIAVDSIVNAPGAGANLAGPWYGTAAAPSHAKMKEGSGGCGECHGGGAVYDARATYLGTNLSNDHPISIGYPSSPSRFNPPPDAQQGWTDVKLYHGKVECSSCHSVHDPANKPFLRIPNAGSALCTKCHAK